MRSLVKSSAITWVVLGLIISLWGSEACGQNLTAKIEGDQVVVTLGGKVFTSYKFAQSLKKPYFWPVNGSVSGKSVTAESIEPFPHHNSLFFGCDYVNGGNYWQSTNDRGQILSQGPKIVTASGSEVVFTDECLWKQPGKDAVIRDHRRVTISAPGRDLRFIDFVITLEPLTKIRIERTNHSLFSARVVPELSVNSGGVLINAEGKEKEKGTFGVPSAWCDYRGSRNGITEGIAILQHPTNKWFPSKWFTRDYGFMSPTPMYWPENEKHTSFAKGELLTLRYRVIVHAGTTREPEIAEMFADYAKTFEISSDELDELFAEVLAYKAGQSRKGLVAVAKLVNETYYSAEARKKLAGRLGKVLAADTSFASKKFACEQLSLIGTEDDVPALAKLLVDEKTSDIARLGLERISGGKVDEALVGALGKLSGRSKVGVINTLGQRGSKDAVEALDGLVYDQDEAVASASLIALGKIGGRNATGAIKKATEKLKGRTRDAALDAYLTCADRLVARGRKRRAVNIYKGLNSKKNPSLIQAAAMRSLLAVSANPETAARALKTDDPQVQAAVFEKIRESQQADIIKAAVEYYPKLSTTAQVQFISSLKDGGNAEVLKIVSGAAKSDVAELRTASLKSLGRVGNNSSISLLAKAAATSAGNEQKCARQSLIDISFDGADAVIVKAIGSAKGQVKCELIKAAAERRTASIGKTLLTCAKDADGEVRLAAIKALGTIADTSAFGEIVNMLVKTRGTKERKELERTTVLLVKASNEPQQLTASLLARYPSVKAPAGKNSLLSVLSELGGDEVLAVLRIALKDDDIEVRKTAIRSLSDWSNAKPADDLLGAAKQDPDQTNQILAVRGCIKLTCLPSGRPVEETVKMLSGAMAVARASEKKTILAALPKVNCPAALELAKSCLGDEAIKADAELAIAAMAK